MCFQIEKHRLSGTLYKCISEWVSEVVQSCPTLCDPVDCSPPGSSVHGILQARVLEWVAMPPSRGSSWPRDWTPGLLHYRLYCWATWHRPPYPLYQGGDHEVLRQELDGPGVKKFSPVYRKSIIVSTKKINHKLKVKNVLFGGNV